MAERAPSTKGSPKNNNKDVKDPSRRDILSGISSVLTTTAIVGVGGIALKNGFEEEDEAPTIITLENRSSDALKRRATKFRSTRRQRSDIPPETITIDFKKLELDKLEWGNVSGMYFNKAGSPTENMEVNFVESLERLQNDKTFRFDEQMLDTYKNIATDIVQALNNEGKQTLARRLQMKLTLPAVQSPERRELQKRGSKIHVKRLLEAHTACRQAVSELRSSDKRNSILSKLQGAQDTIRKYEVVRTMSSTMSTEYKELYQSGEHEPVSFEQLQHDTDSICTNIFKSLDWGAIQSRWKLSNESLSLLQSTVGQIDGNTLLACSMTELLPHVDGKTNRKIYSAIVENAGKAFLARLPSLGDDLLSFGPMQHTRHSINKADARARGSLDHLTRETGGASWLAPFVKSPNRLPDTLEEVLTYEEHMQGAYLNALFNLIVYLRYLDSRERSAPVTSAKRKREFASLNMKDVAIFVSMAHHRPKVAFKRLNTYLDARIAHTQALLTPKKEKIELQPPTSLVHFAGKDLDLYARKTATNYDALAESQFDATSGDFPE